MRSLFYCLAIVVAVIAVDAASKWFTDQYLPMMYYEHAYPYGGIGVFENVFGIEFSIVHAINRGAAWGILASYQDPLMYLRIALIGGTAVYLLFFNKVREYEMPFALILAGAIGNVIDYFVYGHVVDMLHFILWGYDYPVFNVADSAIFVGVFWLFFASYRRDKEK